MSTNQSRPENNFDQLLYSLIAIKNFNLADAAVDDHCIIAELQGIAAAGVMAVSRGLRVFKDGNMWCCVKDGFINLRESPAAFAETATEAIEKFLMAEVKK